MSRAEDYVRRLPVYYAGVLEIEIIAEAWGRQAELFDHELSVLHANQFIATSDSNGLADQEALFGIIASSSESLEFRRKRLLDRRARRPPFTWLWLQERLDDLLEGEYVLLRDVGARTLTVYILLTKTEHLEFITTYVLEVIPANMVVNVVLKYNTHRDLSAFTHRQLARFTHAKIPVQPL